MSIFTEDELTETHTPLQEDPSDLETILSKLKIEVEGSAELNEAALKFSHRDETYWRN